MAKAKRNGHLQLDPANARRHSPRNQALIRQSLETVGAGRSILADANGIVRAGNGVFEQAQALGIPVKVVESDGKQLIAVKRTDLKGKAAVRAAMLDNLAADSSYADYDADILSAIVKDDELIATLAREDKAIAALLAKAEPQAEGDDSGAELVDRAEEVQKKWQCKTGDIYQAGDHFFICGDCREPETWARLLKVAKVSKVNGVFTSPPYAEQRKKQYGGIPTAKYVEWWNAVQANVRANLATDGSFFVNIKPHCDEGARSLYVFDLVCTMAREWNWQFVDELCWTHHGHPGGWNNRFRNEFEPVYQFAVGSPKFKPDNVAHMSDAAFDYSPKNNKTWGTGNEWIGAGNVNRHEGLARPSNVIHAEYSEGRVTGQSAMFPVALPDFFIRAYSDASDVWLDPFAGSGTVIVGAHKNQRRGLGIEILPKYTAVICERLQGIGLTPRKVGDGKAR